MQIHVHIGSFRQKEEACLRSTLCLFSVNALLPLEPPPVPCCWVLFCQILVRGFRSRRAGSCGCEIVRRALLSQVSVADGVLLDGCHPQCSCAVRGGGGAQTGVQGTDAAAGRGSGPDLDQLLRMRGQEGGRGPAAGGGGGRWKLDDAHWVEVAQHFLTLKAENKM